MPTLEEMTTTPKSPVAEETIISSAERRLTLDEMAARPKGVPSWDELDDEGKKKAQQSSFFSTFSGMPASEIYDFVTELNNATGKPTDILPDTPSRIEDITRATAKGILQVSSSMSQIRSIIYNAGSKVGLRHLVAGAWVPVLTAEEREANKKLIKNLDIQSQVTWELANSPQFAMTNHDIFAKATDIAFSNLPNMVASGAAYALTGGAGAVLTTLVFEGNQAKQMYYDNGGTDQTKANAIFFGVGVINGLLELGGFEGVEEVFKLAARKYAAKVTAARVGSVITGSMIAEALQEASQELPHLMAESTYRDIDWNEAVTRVIGSALGGAFLGGLTKAGGVAARHAITTVGRPLPEVELPPMENVLPENKEKVLEQRQEKELAEKVNKVPSETSVEARTPVEPIESTQETDIIPEMKNIENGLNKEIVSKALNIYTGQTEPKVQIIGTVSDFLVDTEAREQFKDILDAKVWASHKDDGRTFAKANENKDGSVDIDLYIPMINKYLATHKFAEHFYHELIHIQRYIKGRTSEGGEYINRKQEQSAQKGTAYWMNKPLFLQPPAQKGVSNEQVQKQTQTEEVVPPIPPPPPLNVETEIQVGDELPSITTARHADLYQELRILGVDIPPSENRQSFMGWYREAISEGIPDKALDISTSIHADDKTINNYKPEILKAGLTLALARLAKQYNTMRIPFKLTTDPAVRANMETEMQQLINQITLIDTALIKVGSATGRGLVASKIAIDENGDLALTLSRAQTKKKAPLTNKEIADYGENVDALNEAAAKAEARRDVVKKEEVKKVIKKKGLGKYADLSPAEIAARKSADMAKLKELTEGGCV